MAIYLQASAYSFWGPRGGALGHMKLGHIGGLGYGSMGKIKAGRIGGLKYGSIGGIYGTSLLGASNPNADALDSDAGGAGSHYNDNHGLDDQVVGSAYQGPSMAEDDQQMLAAPAANNMPMHHYHQMLAAPAANNMPMYHHHQSENMDNQQHLQQMYGYDQHMVGAMSPNNMPMPAPMPAPMFMNPSMDQTMSSRSSVGMAYDNNNNGQMAYGYGMACK